MDVSPQVRVLMFLAAASLPACHGARAKSAARPETPAECEARRQDLAAFVARLPAHAVTLPTRVELPVSIIGAVPGDGPVVEISSAEISMNGQVANEPNLADRAKMFRGWIQALPAGEKPVLYVAATGDLDVRTIRVFLDVVPDSLELRLLVRTPPGTFERESAPEARELAARLLVERDADKRFAIAKEGFDEFAHCDAVSNAVAASESAVADARWPALQGALEKAIPECDCKSLDTASLGLVIGAERRGGASSLAWLPLTFLRDDRCDASMPLRSLEKLIRQIEAFDAEFSGGFENDAMKFGDVVVNDRLRVYFCDALPGETLAAKERAKETLFIRASNGCQGWTFEPLAPGSPMGTLRRNSPNAPPLAFHYRQGAEEIRVFGPVDPAAATSPADERDFACDETFRLTAVDEHAFTLDKGRWYYDADACSRSSEPPFGGAGCVATRIGGESTAAAAERPAAR